MNNYNKNNQNNDPNIVQIPYAEENAGQVSAKWDCGKNAVKGNKLPSRNLYSTQDPSLYNFPVFRTTEDYCQNKTLKLEKIDLNNEDLASFLSYDIFEENESSTIKNDKNQKNYFSNKQNNGSKENPSYSKSYNSESKISNSNDISRDEFSNMLSTSKNLTYHSLELKSNIHDNMFIDCFKYMTKLNEECGIKNNQITLNKIILDYVENKVSNNNDNLEEIKKFLLSSDNLKFYIDSILMSCCEFNIETAKLKYGNTLVEYFYNTFKEEFVFDRDNFNTKTLSNDIESHKKAIYNNKLDESTSKTIKEDIKNVNILVADINFEIIINSVSKVISFPVYLGQNTNLKSSLGKDLIQNLISSINQTYDILSDSLKTFDYFKDCPLIKDTYQSFKGNLSRTIQTSHSEFSLIGGIRKDILSQFSYIESELAIRIKNFLTDNNDHIIFEQAWLDIFSTRDICTNCQRILAHKENETVEILINKLKLRYPNITVKDKILYKDVTFTIPSIYNSEFKSQMSILTIDKENPRNWYSKKFLSRRYHKVINENTVTIINHESKHYKKVFSKKGNANDKYVDKFGTYNRKQCYISDKRTFFLSENPLFNVLVYLKQCIDDANLQINNLKLIDADKNVKKDTYSSLYKMLKNAFDEIKQDYSSSYTKLNLTEEEISDTNILYTKLDKVINNFKDEHINNLLKTAENLNELKESVAEDINKTNVKIRKNAINYIQTKWLFHKNKKNEVEVFNYLKECIALNNFFDNGILELYSLNSISKNINNPLSSLFYYIDNKTTKEKSMISTISSINNKVQSLSYKKLVTYKTFNHIINPQIIKNNVYSSINKKKQVLRAIKAQFERKYCIIISQMFIKLFIKYLNEIKTLTKSRIFIYKDDTPLLIYSSDYNYNENLSQGDKNYNNVYKLSTCNVKIDEIINRLINEKLESISKSNSILNTSYVINLFEYIFSNKEFALSEKYNPIIFSWGFNDKTLIDLIKNYTSELLRQNLNFSQIDTNSNSLNSTNTNSRKSSDELDVQHYINDNLKIIIQLIFEDYHINYLQSSDLLKDLLKTEMSKQIILIIQCHSISKDFKSNNHYVSLIKKCINNKTSLHYIDPMGHPISKEMYSIISEDLNDFTFTQYCNETDERLDINLLINYEGIQAAPLKKSIYYEGNNYDCGPMLVELIYKLEVDSDLSNRHIPLKLEESISLGQILRKQHKKLLNAYNLTSRIIV